MDKVLIVYASWTGATREVAEAIGKTLGETGVQVDVCRARESKDVGSYDAVIVGASVHMNLLSRKTSSFIKRNRKVLAGKPVAYFCVCLAVAEDTEENREMVTGYEAKLREIAPEVKPVDVGMFAGAVLTGTDEYNRLFPLLKTPVKAMADTPDHRDWDAIRAWAEQLGPKLSAGTTG